MSTFLSIPTGLRPKAQGCPVGGTTLGGVSKHFPQPQRGCVTTGRDSRNLVEVEKPLRRFPEIARASPACAAERMAAAGRQPWAGGHCPVGANESCTLAALRDALLPQLLSGELHLLAGGSAQAGVPAAAQLVKAHA